MFIACWWSALVFVFGAVVVLAVPQSVNALDLPDELTALLPVCGQSCVVTFASSAWPQSVCSTDDFLCLCTTKSTTGYTLGEIGVQCVTSSCPPSVNRNDALLKTIYGICGDQVGALPNTHPTLTATSPLAVATSMIVPPVNINNVPISSDFGISTAISTAATAARASSSPTLAFPSTTRPTTTSRLSSTISRSLVDSTLSTSDSVTSSNTTSQDIITSSTPATTPSTVPTFTTTSTQSSSSSSSSSQAPSQAGRPVSKQSSPLTRLQIAGIVVGGLVFLSFVFAVVVLCCMRRRKRQRELREDKSGFKILSSPSPRSGDSLVVGAVAGGSAAPASAQAGQGSGPRNMTSTPNLSPRWIDLPSREIGLAISPASGDATQTSRPTGPGPTRENSKLLPDKPVYRPGMAAPPRSRSFSASTVIEDDTSSVGASSHNSSLDWATAYYRRNVDPDDHLRGYQFARQLDPQWGISRPAPTADPRRPRPRRAGSSVYSRSPSRERRRSNGSIGGYHSRGLRTRYSAASATTLETLSDNEEPVYNNTFLTPVRESASRNNDQATSPISPENLKYPAIPRSLSKPNRRPVPPPFYRNDTYARNEDMVIATTQALSRATGGSAEWTEQNLMAEHARDAKVKQLHLNDEVERARQGINLMRERAATAAANIRNQPPMQQPPTTSKGKAKARNGQQPPRIITTGLPARPKTKATVTAATLGSEPRLAPMNKGQDLSLVVE